MWQQETGAPRPWGDSAYTLRERMGARPTIEVNGLFSGYTGPGSKSIIPEKATAKITCRLVPNQDPNKLMELIQEHIEAHTPATVRSLVYPKRGMPGVIVDRHSPPMQLAVEAYRRVFGKEALFSLEGGSIPAVMMLKETLGVPVIMMGFGLPDDNLHAPNEKFDLEQFRLGLQTVITYYQLLRERMG
jgi:acetylornithine deacetylase/succinyl-diaminopimelate desuccinylase-like protein